ncbi:MAG: hypothetical protein LBT04_06505 [Prevotellaceae bacterium]|jgi:hypothetical protein|nr:hypothetical protein [Prevotellaceae bacterium]
MNIYKSEVYRNWKKSCEERRSTISAPVPETSEQKQKRINRARHDYQYFVSTYYPNLAKCKSAKFHIDAANYLLKNTNTRAVFKWARGHAKSTHLGVFIPMWLKIQQNRTINTVVVVSKSQDSAEKLLADLQEQLEYNDLYISDFGPQVKQGNWATGEFTTNDDCFFKSLGRGQSPRGLKKNGKRPDYIVIDDLDDDELVLNKDRVDKLTRWVKEALFGTMGAEGGRFVMVGNVIAKNSVLENIANIATVHVTQVNARDRNGKPSWPELWTEERIAEREQFMGFSAFQKEYMNNPIVEGSVFSEMHYEKIPPLNRFPFLCCYADPSPSNNKQAVNSMKAAWLMGVIDGKFYVIDGRVARATNAEFVDWFFDLNATVPQGVQVYNAVENNTLQNPFYEQVFIPLFRNHEKINRIVNIIPDTRKKPDKFSRIEGNLEPLNRQGRLILNANKKDDPHFVRLEEQFLLLTPRLSAPADGADCIEGGVWWLQQKTFQLDDGSMTLSGKKVNNKRI